MTLLIEATSLFALALVCQTAAVPVLGRGRQKDHPRWWRAGSRLMQAATALTVAGLGWYGLQTAALPAPPAGIGWGVMGLALWLWPAKERPLPKGLLLFGAGLLLVPLGWGVGRLFGAPPPAPADAPSLWRTGMHWLIAGGLAAMYWLSVIVFMEWGARLFSRRAAEVGTYPLLADRLHRLGAGLLLPGIAGLTAVNGRQGYAIAPQLGPWAALLLLLTALWWLRRARPEHQSLLQVMTLASFGGILLASMYLL